MNTIIQRGLYASEIMFEIIKMSYDYIGNFFLTGLK